MGESLIDRQLEEAERQIREAQIHADTSKLGLQQQDLYLQDQEKGTISEQLDLGDVLDKMYNLLRGYSLKKNDKGEIKWTKPENNDLVVLSEYGISYIMWILQAYLTKNTLLSNYDDKQINEKMEDFSTTITDAIFMEYDKMFLYPTLEECKEELKRRIKQKVDIRKFALELMEQKADEKEIEDTIMREMESRILAEMDIIKQQKIKNKLKRFESVIRMVQDTVHSAYQRAWKGEERTTLRRHIHVSENRGGIPIQVPQQSVNPFSLFRRR